MARRRTEATADDLATALVAAIAELAGCDAHDVRLEAPGLDGGRVTVTLAVEPVDDPHDADADDADADDADVTATEAADTEQDEDTPASSTDRDADRDEDRDDGRPTIDVEELDEEADAAADFMEGLLDALQLPGDLRIRVLEDHAEVEVVEVGTGALIGRRGSTLESIQELLRCALQRRFERRSRVMVDAEGYRARRLEKLLEKAEEAIDDVLDGGDAVRLEPMDVFERKAIHRLVAEHDGVASHSQGREPGRRVVIDRDD